MSPRRMDISSLLRAPSPSPSPRDDADTDPLPRPRTIDALLHHDLPRTAPTPRRTAPPRAPFVGLDALVHVASEERRRIATERDPAPDRLVDSPVRPHLPPHYGHVYSPHSPPRPPSPHVPFPPVPSPSTRLQPSASPHINYPTLRRLPVLHMDPPRPPPPVNDARPILLSPPPPIHVHSPHLPVHSSPSPQRHSPQHLRQPLYSSPIHAPPHIPPAVETDAMSPRTSGPRMAGGIDVLSSNTSPIRPISNYQGIGHDPTERFASESRSEHPRHDPPKLSPLFGRIFSLNEDTNEPKAPPYQPDKESVLPRERVRSRPLHSPPADTTTNAKTVSVSTNHSLVPIRVWEEPPTAREIPQRRLSPVHTPSVVSATAEGRTWVATGESGHGKRPVRADRTAELPHVVGKDGVSPSFISVASTCEQPPPPRVPTLEHSSSDLKAPFQEIRHRPQPSLQAPMEPELPMLSGPQAYVSPTSVPVSPNARAPTSPVLDLHLKNLLEIQPDHQPQCSNLPPSDTIITEELSAKTELTPRAVDTGDILMANPPPRQSPEPSQPVLAEQPETLGISSHASVSRGSSRSPSQQSLSMPLPAKDESDAPSEDALIFPPAKIEPSSRQTPGLEFTSQGEHGVSEQTMMDVDEELLSLVEDKPPRAVAVSSDAPNGSSSVFPQTIFHGLPARIDEVKDRASMPPPAARSKRAEKDKATSVAGTVSGSKKKKEVASKSAAKPKQPSKARPKPAAKPKTKPSVVDTSTKGNIPKVVVNANSRSRSASVIPGILDEAAPEPEADESDKEDDKLYCVCKTRYDEDRMMIACDRCDEWFHTLCVNMPDLEIDLVDQFICPPCIQKHPNLRSTWKRRCFFGLQHANPLSPDACHKPSRGAFSKYCSDDCGIKFMRTQIAQWEKSGGTRNLLWESVKNAAKREGVVVCVETNGTRTPGMMDLDSKSTERKPLDIAAKRRAEREVARLRARLEQTVKDREFMKRELEIVLWREKVVELASERAAKADGCGWDQRLCFGEEEWVDFGQEVMDSYEDERIKAAAGEDAMPLDVVPGEWWCTGKKKCERHAGWQKLRAAEVSFDKETKEGILLKLTTREREIRKGIEDILYPPTGTLQSNQFNGSEKPRSMGHVS